MKSTLEFIPTGHVHVANGAVLSAPGYKSLADIFRRAFDQAAHGKGKERHASDVPFEKQSMQTICGQVGVSHATGQAIKKTVESAGLPHDQKVAELLGAMVYLAGAVLFLENGKQAAPVEVKATPGVGPIFPLYARDWPLGRRRPSLTEMVAAAKAATACDCDECKVFS